MHGMWKGLPIVAALLVPAAAMARDERIPASCVYDESKRLPRDQLVALAKSGFDAKDGKAKALMMQIGMSVSDCTTKNGWGAKRKDAAVRYMTGRVLREDAVFRGKAQGLTPELFDAMVAKLTTADRAGFARGQVSAAMNNALVPQLQAAGIKLDTMTGADRQAFAETLGQGMIGSVIMTDSVVAFNAR